jgi:osmotically-inducible protein OsmY
MNLVQFLQHEKLKGVALTSLRAFLMSLALCGVLDGCALVAAYRHCGFTGCAGDSQISAAVRARFAQHASIEPPNLITVQTIDRVVYLYGLVDTSEQRDLASAVAGEVTGVIRVVNSISINNEGR